MAQSTLLRYCRARQLKNLPLFLGRFSSLSGSLKVYHIAILFLTICISYRGASIAIPDDTPKSTISKENNSLNIFQDYFITNYIDLKCY